MNGKVETSTNGLQTHFVIMPPFPLSSPICLSHLTTLDPDTTDIWSSAIQSGVDDFVRRCYWSLGEVLKCYCFLKHFASLANVDLNP